MWQKHKCRMQTNRATLFEDAVKLIYKTIDNNNV